VQLYYSKCATYSLCSCIRLLVKNLLINHISAPAGKKLEVLRLIASVLGFTQADKDKVGLGSQSGWIGGLWQKLAHPSAKPLPDEVSHSWQPVSKLCQ